MFFSNTVYSVHSTTDWKSLEYIEDGVKVNGLLMKAVLFADDLSLSSSSSSRRTEQNIKRLRDED